MTTTDTDIGEPGLTTADASLMHTAKPDRRTPATTWRLDGHRLSIEPEYGKARQVDLATVTSMCIRKSPSAWDVKRSCCELTTSDSQRIAIISTSWQRLGRYEDRAATYSPLVRALALATEQASEGRCRLYGASQRWVYRAVLAGTGFLLGLLIFMLTGDDADTWSAGSLWGLAAPACMIGFVLVYTRLTLPRELNPQAIPPAFLPPDDSATTGHL